jgi:hypothetical protein
MGHRKGIAKGLAVGAGVLAVGVLTVGTLGVGDAVLVGGLGLAEATVDTGLAVATYGAVGLGIGATALDCSEAIDARCAVDAVSTATVGLGVGLGEAGLAGSEFLSASELADLAEPLGVFADIGLAGYGGGLGLGAVAMPGSDKKCSPQ